MRVATVLLSCGLLGGCSSIAIQVPAADAPGPVAQRLAGAWRSVAPEREGHHHALRSFEFTERDWQVTYRAFADAQASQPLFTIRVAGPYMLGDASTKVQGAVEGIFPARSRTVTADSEAGVRMFAGMGCTLVRCEPKSLRSTGCGFLPGLMQVMGEYDLVALQDGRLFLGDRSGDLSKARPEKLTPYPLVPAR